MKELIIFRNPSDGLLYYSINGLSKLINITQFDTFRISESVDVIKNNTGYQISKIPTTDGIHTFQIYRNLSIPELMLPRGKRGLIGPPGPAGPAGTGGLLLFTGVNLISSEILSLSSSPVTIVTLPALSNDIHVVRSAFFYSFGTTPYVVGGGDTVGLKIATAPNDSPQTSSDILTATTDKNCCYPVTPGTTPPNNNSQLIPNQNLEVTMVNLSGGAPVDPTLGDGSLRVLVWYVLSARP